MKLIVKDKGEVNSKSILSWKTVTEQLKVKYVPDGKKNVNQGTKIWHYIDERCGKRKRWNGGESQEQKEVEWERVTGMDSLGKRIFRQVVKILNFILWTGNSGNY